jgi:hypothetical protein
VHPAGRKDKGLARSQVQLETLAGDLFDRDTGIVKASKDRKLKKNEVTSDESDTAPLPDRSHCLYDMRLATLGLATKKEQPEPCSTWYHDERPHWGREKSRKERLDRKRQNR